VQVLPVHRRLEKEVADMRAEVGRETIRAGQERVAVLAATVEEAGKKLQVPPRSFPNFLQLSTMGAVLHALLVAAV
jgi:hypothetical protein